MALKREDWTLLTLAAAEGQTLTPVQLQKCLFLLGKAKPEAVGNHFYNFTPYNYGPFDRQVYIDADRLAAEGLATITGGSSSTGRWNEYAITPAGMTRVRDLQPKAGPAWDYVRRVVEWARQLTFQQLVRAIYARYPEFRVNSVFQG